MNVPAEMEYAAGGFTVPLPEGTWTIELAGEDMGYSVTEDFARGLAERVTWMGDVKVVNRVRQD